MDVKESLCESCGNLRGDEIAEGKEGGAGHVCHRSPGPD